jgi:hypothetical protein
MTLAESQNKGTPTQTPTTAQGWINLAAKQSPAEAAVSIRHALELNPGWADALGALCVELAAARDDAAIAACDDALRALPNEMKVLASRGAARVRGGLTAAGLADLDRVVAADPDPLYRRLRGRARLAAGDRAGAARDFEAACKLGNTASCGPGQTPLDPSITPR